MNAEGEKGSRKLEAVRIAMACYRCEVNAGHVIQRRACYTIDTYR